jgi:hypothetical protein
MWRRPELIAADASPRAVYYSVAANIHSLAQTQAMLMSDPAQTDLYVSFIFFVSIYMNLMEERAK